MKKAYKSCSNIVTIQLSYFQMSHSNFHFFPFDEIEDDDEAKISNASHLIYSDLKQNSFSFVASEQTNMFAICKHCTLRPFFSLMDHLVLKKSDKKFYILLSSVVCPAAFTLLSPIK